jgi:hypothetical protein
MAVLDGSNQIIYECNTVAMNTYIKTYKSVILM